MHSLNIARCIKLNDRPDSIIHQIESGEFGGHMSGAMVCHSATCVHDIDELRQRLLHVRRGLKQSLIDDAVNQ